MTPRREVLWSRPQLFISLILLSLLALVQAGEVDWKDATCIGDEADGNSCRKPGERWPQPDPAITPMLEWLEHKGLHGVLPSAGGHLEVRTWRRDKPDALVTSPGHYEGMERGVFATAPFKKGDTILRFQFSMSLSSGVTERNVGTRGRLVRLISNLLKEKAKKRKSRFFKYIDSLPRRVSLPAIHFTPQEWEEFHYRPFINLLKTVMGVFKDGYAGVQAADIANATFEEFLWAGAMCLSRPFQFPEFDKTGEHTGHSELNLAPYLDLLNHAHDHRRNINWAYGPGECHMWAAADIEEGQELFHSYTEEERAGNDFLMAAYGFYVEKNPKDYNVLWDSAEELVEWHLGTYGNCTKSGAARWGPQDDVDNEPFLNKFKSLLAIVQEKEPNQETVLVTLSSGDPHKIVLDTLSALWKARHEVDCMPDTFHPSTDAGVRTEYLRVRGVSEDNKLPDLVLATVQRRCSEVLRGYPTTMEEDTRLLESATKWLRERGGCVFSSDRDGGEGEEGFREDCLSPPFEVKFRSAIGFRREKKRTLQRTIDRIEARYLVVGAPTTLPL